MKLSIGHLSLYMFVSLSAMSSDSSDVNSLSWKVGWILSLRAAVDMSVSLRAAVDMSVSLASSVVS